MNFNFDKRKQYLTLSLLLILIGANTNIAVSFIGILVGIKGFWAFKSN
ncbi:hypothetical protein [Enterococcus sp. AZ103]